MTLNVSLRVPDGIVIASDSLSTVSSPINQKMNLNAQCKACGEDMLIEDVAAPPLSVPVSTWPYAQKLFPISSKFGIATNGNAYVNGRSIYNHVTALNPTLPTAPDGEDEFELLSEAVSTYFHNQLVTELSKSNLSLDLIPDTWAPLGFHFVGFSKDAHGDPIAQTRLIHIGKQVTHETYDSIGCTWSGDGSVVSLLWGQQGTGANYTVFSLQDAIDYARFLIRTTADYQRFSGRMPTVGGDIDIALVTNYRGFQWIAQKELYKLLDQETNSKL